VWGSTVDGMTDGYSMHVGHSIQYRIDSNMSIFLTTSMASSPCISIATEVIGARAMNTYMMKCEMLVQILDRGYWELIGTQMISTNNVNGKKK